MITKFARAAALSVLLLSPALGACAMFDGRESAGQEVDDTAISTKVRTKILADEDLKLRQIDVETMKGVVQLSGFVGSMSEKAKATSVARDTGGVVSVKNDLVVR